MQFFGIIAASIHLRAVNVTTTLRFVKVSIALSRNPLQQVLLSPPGSESQPVEFTCWLQNLCSLPLLRSADLGGG